MTVKPIKTLFDPSRDIYRTIEKVITYGAAQETRLRAEISEYIVTESIEEQMERLLDKMQLAMDIGGQHEIGVWVSGFYGSGKSSFTKYLGLALDEHVAVDGVRFLKHLQDRMVKPTTRALLATVAARYPAAVVMLDLASEMVAGASMEDVSTVLYYKVLQIAGYSRNLKVAAFERRLKKDGRYEDFTARIEADLDVTWPEVQNDPLVIDSVLPEIAHAMYPELFKTPLAFTTEVADYVRFENEQVKEMLDIVREHSGKEYVLFIVDEVGQYVASRPNLILNLDGLAKNLKAIGDGKVWIMGTAQQTLTEDDPRAALNSPELFKLAARFPIQIDLESDDIKEICYRRLLTKSPAGVQVLGELFDRHGQMLRHNTKLQDARYYDADFDRATFINLYPFLPAHFGVLLHLLGELAKSTGGIGLRSAIKVLQDILVEGAPAHLAAAEQPIGWLATTVTLYDALEKDISRGATSEYRGVEKVKVHFLDSPQHQGIAKTVAILQILDNIPITPQNIASFMHPSVDAPARNDEINAAIAELVNHPRVPFGEKDGNLCFFSEKINDIDQERAQLSLRAMETRRIHNEALREVFNPLPATRLHGTLAVTAGLKILSGATPTSLAGERETIQLLAELVDAANYDTARARLVEESRQRSAQNTLYLLGRTAPDVNDRLAEIFRAQEIAQRYRNDPDGEVREYCTGQLDRATRLSGELQGVLDRALTQGSFIFRGQVTAVDTLAADVLNAAKAYLAEAAKQVFDRYGEAPVRAETALAEKFLRVGNLKAVTTAVDPLELVQISAGKPVIQSDHKALLSIRDYIDRNGAVEGKRLLDYFSDAPFGWSQDTLRYLVAALLAAGEIVLKVSGREVTVNGQQAIEALRTNNAFKSVGVALRNHRPSNQVLARAAERLTDLVGEMVLPLEDEISKTAVKHFPAFQFRFGPLAEKLVHLGLPGAISVRALNQDLADVLLTDASDAPQRLGGEQSPLYDRLKWADAVERALQAGLETTLREIQQHRSEIETLPEYGAPGALRTTLAEELELFRQRLQQDTFYTHVADFNTLLTTIKTSTRDAATKMQEAQSATVQAVGQELQRLPEWGELTQEEQAQALAQIEGLVRAAPRDLAGLKQVLSQEYALQMQGAQLKRDIVRLGHERQLARQQTEKETSAREGRQKVARTLAVPGRVRNMQQLDALIQQLQALKAEVSVYSDIEITLQLG